MRAMLEQRLGGAVQERRLEEKRAIQMMMKTAMNQLEEWTL